VTILLLLNHWDSRKESSEEESEENSEWRFRLMAALTKIKRGALALNWERAKCEIIAEVRLDPVNKIKDQAQQLVAYAIRRNDPEILATASAVALRAHYRIGQISKALPAIGHRPKKPPINGRLSKVDILRNSKISWASAQRSEQLTEIISEKEVDKICQQAVDECKRALSANAIYLQDQDDKKKAKFREIRHKLPPNLHVGDFRDLSPVEIATDSVDLIFTDPPYNEDAVPLYEAAANEAARILKPGGSLIIYCGHLILPAVLPLMMAHLKYHWIAVEIHSGSLARMNQYGVVVGFKPLLWFVKNYRYDKQTFVLDTVIGKKEKDTHPWQQSVKAAEHFISLLTLDGGVVVDFFAGGGTTLLAAKNLGRKWIAFENDEKAVPAIYERLGLAAGVAA
jgi:DNA modification methylase